MSTILKANVKNRIAGTLLLVSITGVAVSSLPAYGDGSKHESVAVSVKDLEKKKSQTPVKKPSPLSKSLLYYRSNLDKELIVNIDQTIAYLEKLAKESAAGSAARLKFLVKILNLNFEQAIYISNQETFHYDHVWQDWSNNGQKGVEPELDESLSKSHWQSVADVARRILHEYPKAPMADCIIYDEAIAEQNLAQREKAAASLLKLVHDYPNSTLFYDAQFALGEYYFDTADFPQALTRFTKSLHHDNATRYGWGLFKIAWCYFNLGNYLKAIEYWEKSISYAETKIDDEKKSAILKDAAFRDLIWGFLEVQDTAGAIAYYRKHKGEEYLGPFLKRLANNYSNKGFRKEAYETWQVLLKEVPLAKEAFEAQTEIVAASYDAKNYDGLWPAIEQLYSLFRSDSVWVKANHKDDVEDVQKKMPVLIAYYPKALHQQAQKNNRPELYGQAIKGYTLYLKLYPRPPDYAEVMEYLADIYYLQNNFEKAGQVYASLVKLGKEKAVILDEKGQVKQNIHERAGKNMMDASSKDFLPEFEILLKITPDFKRPGRPIGAKAKNFIDACALYQKWYPADKTTAKNCDIQIGEIYYRSAQAQQAKVYLYILLTKYPGEKEGMAAAENLIVLVKDKKPELIEAATKILTIPIYAKSPLGLKLRKLLRGLEIEAIEREPSKKKRADMYEDKVKKSPQDPEADKFLYNAGNDYLSAGEVPKARDAFANLVSTYPRSTLHAATVLTLGKLYDKTLDSKNASQYYILYGQSYSKEKEAPAAQQRACELLMTENYIAAWEQCRIVVARDPPAGIPLVERFITIAWYEKNYPWMISLINQTFMQLPATAEQKIVAAYKVTVVGTPDQKTQATKQIQQLAKQKNLSGEALRYVAELHFQDSEKRYTQQMTLKLQGASVDNLQGSIQKLSDGLAALEKAYDPTLKTQDAYWGVAVFYRLATAYEAFARMMMNPPAVEGVAAADLKTHLQSSVDQMMGKAKEYYGTGLGVARKFNVYNAWVPLLIQADRRLKGKSPMVPAWVLSPDFVGGVAAGQQTQLLE